MSLGTFLFVYVLGGLTFLPLSAIVFFAALLYLSPPVGDNDPAKATKDKLIEGSTTTTSEPEKEKEKTSALLPKPLQGWIVVRRTFEEPSQDNASYMGNLMRSFLDSKQSTSSSGSKPRRPRDTFYAVLKGTVLYLYEDEACSDCYAALQVAAYDVDIWPTAPGMTDGELFTRRNAIRLRAKDSEKMAPGMPMVSKDMSSVGDKSDTAPEKGAQATPTPSPSPSDEHFIFVKSNIVMEDWYLALVYATTCDPKSTAPSATSSLDPLPSLQSVFSTSDMEHLVRTLDKQPDPIPMRWLNALIGRIFFSLYQTSGLEAMLIARLMKKIAKVPRPAFLTDLSVREVNVGSTPPLFHKPMLKELTKEGDAAVEMGMTYKSVEGEHTGIRVTVEATITINLKETLPLNLGNRWDLKPRTVKIVLAVIIRSLEGNLLIRVKRPPSNRLWWGFTSMPKMDIELLPIVSDRKIKWSLILKPIENLLRDEIQDSVVLPHMDDMPFFDTEAYDHRGGIWADAVRTVYDFSGATAAATTVSTPLNEDGSSKISTISPSTVVPVSSDIDLLKHAATKPKREDTDDGTTLSLPGEYRESTSESDADIAAATRNSTTASLPSSWNFSTSPRRTSWFSRFGGTAKSTEPGTHPNGETRPQPQREKTIPEILAEGIVEEEFKPTPQPTPNGSPAVNPVEQPSEEVKPMEALPQSTHVELNGSTIDLTSAEPNGKPFKALSINPATAKGSDDDKASLNGSIRSNILDGSYAASPASLSPTAPTLPPRKRSTTQSHQATQSLAADFLTPPISRTNTFASSSSTAAPLKDELAKMPESTVTSAGLTPIAPAIPKTPDMGPSPPTERSPSPVSLKDSGSTSSQPTTAQALFTAWKNRNTDKQALANTARDVARDTMKKWGFGVKKDTVDQPPPVPESPAPALPPRNQRPTTPGSGSISRTFAQMRAEVEERWRERTTHPNGSQNGDAIHSDGEGSTASGPTAPFRPPSPKPTTHLQTTPKFPSSSSSTSTTPPPLPPRDLPPPTDERLRRASNNSDQAPAIPIQRQPGQLASMSIPGIHAKHKGEVMALGSNPLPPPSTNSEEDEDHNAKPVLGPNTAATLQSMYRLFNRRQTATASGEDATQGALNASQERVSQDDASREGEEPTPTEPSAKTLAPSPTPSTHERTRSDSSATSFLKQIQAQDARRSSDEPRAAAVPTTPPRPPPLPSRPSKASVREPSPDAKGPSAENTPTEPI